jgi:ubiquinone/menaquinone biosynthesis C-methylase UbiE
MAQEKDLEVKFFDSLLLDKRDQVFTDAALEKITSIIFKYIDIGDENKNLMILDAGCGTGIFTGLLLKRYSDVYGIDIHKRSITMCVNNISKGKFFVSDLEQIGVMDGQFDVITMFGVLHHFKEHDKLISEIYRILKPHGKLIAFEKNMNNPLIWLYRNSKSPFYSKDGETENESPIRYHDIKEKLELYNFSVKRKMVSGLKLKNHYSNLIRRFLFLFNFSEMVFERIDFLKRYWAQHFIIYAIKD